MSRSAHSFRWMGALLLCSVFFAAPAAAEGELKTNPKAAADAFDEGEAMREEGKASNAMEAYWRAIEADVRHYRAHVRYQDAGLQSGRTLDEIRSDYDALIGDYPEVPQMKLHRARLMPPAKRLGALTAYLSKHKGSFEALMEMGRAHLALDDGKAALKTLKQAAGLAPSDRIDAALLLAEAQIRAGDTDDAAKRMEAAVASNPQFWLGHLTLARIELAEGNFEAARKYAETVLGQRPSYVAAFLVRAEAYVGEGNRAEALKTLQAAHRIASTSPDVLCALGDVTAYDDKEKSLAAALPMYQAVLATNPEHIHASYGVAWVYERQKKYDKAEQLYRQVALLRPKSAKAVNSVGFCLMKQGRISEAQIQFKKAMGIDETFVTAIANLAATLDAQSKFAEAIKIYEQILKMKGEKENLRALINCAFDYEALTSFSKAVKYLERAHKIVPTDPNICVWLGDDFYFQKKWTKAEKWYKKAISLSDVEYYAWRGLGYSLVQRKKFEDALAALEKAAELNAEEKDLLLHIGDIYLLELKDVEKAKAAFEKYVARGGDDPDILDLLDELRGESKDDGDDDSGN